MKIEVMYTRYSTRNSTPVRIRRFKDQDTFESWLDDDDQWDVKIIRVMEIETGR